ncbi:MULTISPECIES: hypothetical protein [Roseomonadaceae]|uniref:Uncharacterized protein n=1 Tax=Falsiroseomonas oleicola TaxID=2801474 RepID=A0ABS6H5V0_9PROT|nr:hypothetical protein [Roseomonas oleicola]MBU8544068.1 hypothetical protein [Roseomonas oleicola]
MNNALHRRPPPAIRSPRLPSQRRLADRPARGSAVRGIGVALLLSALFWVGLAWVV